MNLKLQAITKGSQIIDQIFWELFDIIKHERNLTELDLARFIKRRAKQLGAGGMAFRPIVSFGKNAAEIHHIPAANKIGKNNFLMLDYGVRINGYCSDFTRTLFLGKPNKFHKKIYNLVLKSQLSALKKVKPGVVTGQIDAVARDIIKKAGYGKYFSHGTGHGIGKKIHEWPSFKPDKKDKLPKNCVMTVEPGIYLPNKFGMRIEDMVLVTKKPRLRQGSGGQAKIFSKIPKDFKSMIIARR